MTGDAIEVNRRLWNQMATLHQQTYFADPDHPNDEDLSAFEQHEIGSVAGQRICHLQCHLGGESLALARMGATVVGVDFSPVAVQYASERAQAAGLTDRVAFVCASVDDAPAETGGAFDGVYTSWGVLCWLPDIDAWARSVAALLTPGGWLYLAETHPQAMTLRWPEYHYGGSEAIFDDQQGDYTDADACFEHPESWQWNWSLGEIVTALADAGLHVEWLHEHPVVRWHLGTPDQLARVDGLWTRPGSTLPLSFSLRAVLPARSTQGRDARGVIVRTRTEDDLDDLDHLARLVHQHDGYPPRRADDLRAFIASAGALAAWVAEIDGTVVGHVALNPTSSPEVIDLATEVLDHPADQLGVVARLLVHPQQRSRGIGGALLDAAAAEAVRQGLCPILDVARHFEAAIRLYERSGWTLLGAVTMRFPDDDPLDELVYGACRHRSQEPASRGDQLAGRRRAGRG